MKPRQTQPAPRRCWIPLLVVNGLLALQATFILAVGSVNSGLIEFLGAERWSDLPVPVQETLAVIVRMFALCQLALVGLAVAVTLFALRRTGARWAWGVLWLLPLYQLALFANDVVGLPSAAPETNTLGPVTIVPAAVSVVALLLGRPREIEAASGTAARAVPAPA